MNPVSFMLSIVTRMDARLSGKDARERQLLVIVSSPEMQEVSLANVHPDMLPSRDTGVNVIIQLVQAYESKPETLAHAIVLLDKSIASGLYSPPDPCTSQRIVEAAVGCFMIAVKFREVMHPCVRDLSVLTSCTSDGIRNAEEVIAQALEWNVNVTTGDNVRSIHAFRHFMFLILIILPSSAVDLADKILEGCEDRRRARLSKYVTFLVKLAYCCRELSARYSAIAVTVACVIYSARILGDRSAEEELVPGFMRAAGAADALDGLRAACRSRGYY